jgi:hypothetical protein
MRSRRLKGVMLALAASIVVLALSCGLGGAAVRAGTLAPPDVDLELGETRLVGRLSIIPFCSQLISAECVTDKPVPRERIYTLWLFSRRQPGTWERAEVRQIVAVSVGSRR